jgi:3'-phosphoadenosine 5'-phosphosulfate sulfotransferase (PAPS reductase)/FAD synthetase
MGLRAEESVARATCPSCKGKGELNAETGKALSKKALKAGVATVTCPRCDGKGERVDFERDPRQSNSAKSVDTWLPIHDWTEPQVWDRIKASGVPYHRAYDLGMPRLSCCFCIFAPREALIIAGHENRELLADYVATEAEVGHSFKANMKIAEIADAVDAGERPELDGSWGPQ